MPAAEAPTAADFTAHLGQSGPNGGCRALPDRDPKRRKGLVQIDEHGNHTPYDARAIREEAEDQAWQEQHEKDRIRAEQRRQENGPTLFEYLSNDTIDQGEELRRRMQIEQWNRHKRRRVRRKILGGFSLPLGHKSPGKHGKGDWGDGPWSKGQITGVFKRMKRRRMVPPNEARKEMWEIALEHTEELGENVTGLLNGMFSQNVCPLEWNNATGAQIGKANGKRGCKAIRIINLLPSEGKAFSNLYGNFHRKLPHDTHTVSANTGGGSKPSSYRIRWDGNSAPSNVDILPVFMTLQTLFPVSVIPS